MNADETLFKYAIENSRQQKEEIVSRCGVGSDLQPMLALHRDSELIGMVHLPANYDAKLSAITAAVAHSAANIVVSIDEGYWWVGASAFDYLMHAEFGRHGDLARKFAAGDPKVVESLHVSVFTPEYATLHIAPYCYAGRTVTWRPEPVTFDDKAENRAIDGNVYLAVREGFELQATTEPASTPQGFARATGLQPVMPLGPRPDRNAPCPCGSGRKSKRCCFA